MTDKQLKKLKRVELLELLVEQSSEMEELREKLRQAEAALEKRDLKLQNAGSMAEAALSLREVFEAADLAAGDFLNGVRSAYESREAMLEETRAHCKNMEDETRAKCEEMLRQAKADGEGEE